MDDRSSLSPRQQADFDRFMRRVLSKCGIDLSQYREAQMHRRLWAMVERCGLRTFDEYFRLLDRDAGAWTAFLDRITINVSELFRNPDRWRELRDSVLPGLCSDRRPLRVWSAGCSYGAEPFTLAMILDEMAPGVRHRITATDIDERILAKAREGRFTDADVRHVPAEARGRYLEPRGGLYTVAPSLRQRVDFRRHNLLADPFPSGLDLIVCRNVIIYFTENAKAALYRRFRAALRPGGVLFVGGTERVVNHREIGLDATLPFFYVRVQ